MPIQYRTYQSKINSSFWFISATSRVRHFTHTYFMDDFGNLQALDFNKFAVIVTN